MPEMNPYYARESTVGPVFDVATWNPRFSIQAVVFGLGMFAVFGAASYAFYDPTVLTHFDADITRNFQREFDKIWNDQPLGCQIGLAIAVFLSYVGLAAVTSSVTDCNDGDFYLRVGPAGMSLRVPDGLDFSKLGFVSHKLQLDLPWSQIAAWRITQTKRLGSMSPHSGNISASLTIATADGKKHIINLDYFRENGHIIHKRIGEAAEMTALQFDPQQAPTAGDAVAAGPSESREVIEAVLIKQLYSQQSAVIFSDAATDKFVQFAVGGGKILLDLPMQALDDAETRRAGDVFARNGAGLQTSELLDQPGGVAVGVQESFQIELGSNVERGADLAMDIFHEVYGLPEGFSLTVEEV